MIDFNKDLKEETNELDKDHDINDFNQDAPVSTKKRKKFSFYIISFLVVALVFSGKVIMSSQNAQEWLSNHNFFNTLKQFIPSDNKQVAGENEDRINILLLGMGGEGHDGPYLTDTIMIASLKPSTKQVSLLSIPRDLYIPIPGYSWGKINNVNAYAEANKKNGSLETANALAELFDIPLHYYVRADFQGFINIINEIGGIEVNVENTLEDPAYPILGQEDNPNYYARFEHLYVKAGLQKMDGSLALKFVRSRHGYNGEGSDFARARRQQLVLEAVKNKLFSKQTLLNPVTISHLIKEFNQHISTNLESWEILRIWSMFKDTSRENIINNVLSDAPNNYLVASTANSGAFILSPKTGNFSAIKAMIKSIFPEIEVIEEEDEVEVLSETLPIATELKKDTVKIAVLNGTWITGLAAKTTNQLNSDGYRVSLTKNAPEREYNNSFLLDLSYGQLKEIIADLENTTGIEQGFSQPSWLENYQNQNPDIDIIILLGTDKNK